MSCRISGNPMQQSYDPELSTRRLNVGFTLGLSYALPFAEGRPEDSDLTSSRIDINGCILLLVRRGVLVAPPRFPPRTELFRENFGSEISDAGHSNFLGKILCRAKFNASCQRFASVLPSRDIYV